MNELAGRADRVCVRERSAQVPALRPALPPSVDHMSYGYVALAPAWAIIQPLSLATSLLAKRQGRSLFLGPRLRGSPWPRCLASCWQSDERDLFF